MDDQASRKMLRELIWHAANGGSPWVWYFLKLAKPADLEYGSQAHNGESAVMRAARSGFTDIVHLLEEHGANINQTDKYGSTALMCAAQNGRISTVKLLARLDGDVDMQNKFGHSALMYAAKAGKIETVLTLLVLGARRGSRSKLAVEERTAADMAQTQEIRNLINYYVPPPSGIAAAASAMSARHKSSSAATTTANTTTATTTTTATAAHMTNCDAHSAEHSRADANAKGEHVADHRKASENTSQHCEPRNEEAGSDFQPDVSKAVQGCSHLDSGGDATAAAAVCATRDVDCPGNQPPQAAAAAAAEEESGVRPETEVNGSRSAAVKGAHTEASSSPPPPPPPPPALPAVVFKAHEVDLAMVYLKQGEDLLWRWYGPHGIVQIEKYVHKHMYRNKE